MLFGTDISLISLLIRGEQEKGHLPNFIDEKVLKSLIKIEQYRGILARNYQTMPKEIKDNIYNWQSHYPDFFMETRIREGLKEGLNHRFCSDWIGNIGFDMHDSLHVNDKHSIWKQCEIQYMLIEMERRPILNFKSIGNVLFFLASVYSNDYRRIMNKSILTGVFETELDNILEQSDSRLIHYINYVAFCLKKDLCVNTQEVEKSTDEAFSLHNTNSHFNKENLPQYFWRYIKDSYQTNWWFDLNLEVLYTEIDDFIRRYVYLCMKYGINIPSDLLNDQSFKSIQEYIHRISPLVKIKAKKHIIHLFTGYYKRDEQQTLLNNTIMFVQGQQGVLVQIAYPNDKDDCLDLSIGTFDRNATTFFIRLGTNAFFSDLYEYGDEEDNTDNSALAYLNTPRLNSYIRDFTRLMLEYGCTNYGTDGLESEEFFKAPYLLVDGEVLFYEDVYELLPEEQRYKPFEEIGLNFDKKIGL